MTLVHKSVNICVNQAVLKFPLTVSYIHFHLRCFTGLRGSVVEHPLRDREVVGSNPGRAIPKMLKMVPVATLLSIIRQALASLLLNIFRTTNIATLTKNKKSEKSPIIINVCIHRRTV